MVDWTRRDFLGAGMATLVAGSALASWAADPAPATQPGKGKRILFFTRSQGFPHSVVTRRPGEPLAFAERLLQQWATAAGYEIVISKDGTIFTPDNIARFDAFIFYTTGDLTQPPANAKSDQTPPMSPEGKTALLDAIANGKGFVGLHSATDTFENPAHKKDPVAIASPDVQLDPYCAMLGGEFTSHAKQQLATIRVADGAATALPGLAGIKDFELLEEWYAFTNLAPDLHVLLIQDTTTMHPDPATGLRDPQYRGHPYPETWARMHHKGRVFYTGMGHRDDVWFSARYQQIVMAGLAWACGIVGTSVQGNLATTCPGLTKT